MAKKEKVNRSILALIIASVIISIGIGALNITGIIGTSKTNSALFNTTVNANYDQNIRYVT